MVQPSSRSRECARSMTRTTLIVPTGSHAEHDEQTFRSLLDLEHRKCRQSGQAFHVLLCRLSTQSGTQLLMTDSITRALISAVKESLGKTDHMGWFLQDLVLGALLLNKNPSQSAVSSGNGTSRVRRLIESRLSPTYPSVVVQFYDYLDLPPIKYNTQDQTFARDF